MRYAAILGVALGVALTGVLLSGCGGGGSKTDAVFHGSLGPGDSTLGSNIFVDAYTAEKQADKGQSAKLDFDVTQGTTYFVYVRAGGLRGSGGYTLRVSDVLQSVHEQSSLTPAL